MVEIDVRVLTPEDWEEYREVRLASLADSPGAFLATYADEEAEPEQYWRTRMAQADRLLASRDGSPLGVVSVQPRQEPPRAANLCDLWVTPTARATGVAWSLVQAGAVQAVRNGCTQLYYWVGSENGRAIAFASNAGFRVTSERRTIETENTEFGDQEIALVLSLTDDPVAVPSSAPSLLAPKPGPR